MATHGSPFGGLSVKSNHIVPLSLSAAHGTGDPGKRTGHVETLSGNVWRSAHDVGALSGDVNAPADDLEALTGDVDALSGDAEMLSVNVDALTGDVDALTFNVFGPAKNHKVLIFSHLRM